MEFILLFFSDLQKNSNIKTPPLKPFKLFKQKLTSEYASYSFTDLQTYSNIKKIITSVFGSKSPLFQETSSLRLSELRRRSIHGFYFVIKIAGGCLPFVQFSSTIISSFCCRYHLLSYSPPQQNFRQLFFSFRKVWGYPTLLISWFINFNNSEDGIDFSIIESTQK